jgi:site-specific DNA recombinase
MDVKKRVACLYRVSTQMQVSADDDLPVQRNACKEFIGKHPEWEFCCEYLEKGVSGYKKTLAERDVLQQVRADAELRLFDVLLVFMFDRVGRIESESPFVVQWFVEHGIEVWSVNEGQQKFDSHTDSLTNFIRFWQAEGESIKTSLRVDEALKQKTRAGQYVGGKPPYGYRRIPTGEITKRGRVVTKLEIDPEQAKVVRLIFDLSIKDRFGGHKIAQYLNENRYLAKMGGQWSACNVNYILRNPVYKGYLAYGKTSAKCGTQRRMCPDKWILSDHRVEELAIISEEKWSTVQRIRNSVSAWQQQRKEENLKIEHHKLNKSPLLLIGFIRCGVCGYAMNTGYSSSKWVTKSGEVHRTCRAVYKCIGRTSGHIGCTAKVSHQAENLEGPVLEEIYKYMDTLKEMDLSKDIEKLRKQNLDYDEKLTRDILKEKAALEKAQNALKNQIMKVITGEADFDKTLINQMYLEAEEKMADADRRYAEAKKELELKKLEHEDLAVLQNSIPVWREEFEKAPFEVKKVLLSHIIDQIVVYPERIDIILKMHINDFLNKADMANPNRSGITSNGDPTPLYEDKEITQANLCNLLIH